MSGFTRCMMACQVEADFCCKFKPHPSVLARGRHGLVPYNGCNGRQTPGTHLHFAPPPPILTVESARGEGVFFGWTRVEGWTIYYGIVCYCGIIYSVWFGMVSARIPYGTADFVGATPIVKSMFFLRGGVFCF